MLLKLSVSELTNGILFNMKIFKSCISKKQLHDYKFNVEMLSSTSYQGVISYNDNDYMKNIGWLLKSGNVQIGQDITYRGVNANGGIGVSINSDGTRIACVQEYVETYNYSSTIIYELSTYNNKTSWIQIGEPIVSSPSVERAGKVVLNSAGDILIIVYSVISIGSLNITKAYKLSSYNNNKSWVTLGQNISGYGDLEIDMNDTGDTIIMGNPTYNNKVGSVKMYKLSTYGNDNSWVQLGQSINGLSANFNLGSDVAINSIGDTIVFGTEHFGTSAFNTVGNAGHLFRGKTEVYKLSTYNNNNSWVQVGQSIIGMGGDNMGKVVDINSAGNKIVTVGGGVKVYELSTYNGNNLWVQIGSTVPLSSTESQNYDYMNVSINSYGDLFSISTPYANYEKKLKSGIVRTYKLSSNNEWVQRGVDIGGYLEGDACGQSIAIDSSGDTIIIGYPDFNNPLITGIASINAGLVKVFKYKQEITYDDTYKYTAYNDNTIIANRPRWKNPSSLYITGGWYDTFNKTFITDINTTSLTAEYNSDKFISQYSEYYKGYKWIEVATKKNTNTQISAIQSASICFKKDGFDLKFKKNPQIKWNYNSKIATNVQPIDNMFINLAPNSVILSASDPEEIYENPFPEIASLSAKYTWTIGTSSLSSTIDTGSLSSKIITLNEKNDILCNYTLSTFSYKNPTSKFRNTEAVIYLNSDILELGNKSAAEIKSKLLNTPVLTSTTDVFSVKNPTSNIFIRNPNMWCYYLTDQLTSNIVYKSGASKYSYGGILITPRHVLYVAHIFPVKNINVTFVTSNNIAVSAAQLTGASGFTYKTQIDLLSVGYVDSSYYTDIGIAVLDRDISLSGIHIMPMAAVTPTELKILNMQYMPKISTTQGAERLTNTPNPNPLSSNDIKMVMSSTNFKNMSLAYDSNSANPYYNWDVMGNWDNTGSAYKFWDGDSGIPHLLLCNSKLYVYSLTTSANTEGAKVAALSAIVNLLIEKADQLAGINTGLKPTYYTINQIVNR